jgi:hypothetical protein
VRNAQRWFVPLVALALAGFLAPLALAQQGPDLPESVDINIDTDDGEAVGPWYVNPVWLAIGAIAVILLVVVIVLAARGGGGGSTVVTR